MAKTDPTACAIMLVNRRPEMVARAIRSFREQTYPEKSRRLLLFDTTPEYYTPFDTNPLGIIHAVAPLGYGDGKTIGWLRNEANGTVPRETSDDDWIIIHWDSDDWSHPRRVEEQVALLQSSGKECVGYRDMLFWDTMLEPFVGEERPSNEAWLYTNGDSKYVLGTSLCYWRRVWEQRPFEALPKGPTGEGEDSRWLREVDSLGVCVRDERPSRAGANPAYEGEPRMIASVHDGNTSSMVALAIRRGASEMKRVPQWDEYCRERMAL